MNRLSLIAITAVAFVPLAFAHAQTAQSTPVMEYSYPLENPYAATIIGTPPELKAKPLSTQLTERKLVVFPDRKVPEGFWYYDGLHYGEMLQSKPAPLVYIIGGTGSGYRSRYTVAFANVLYRAGYHVVTLPSTTHSNFIVTASSNFFPGNAGNDAADLYNVINLIQPKITKKVQVTSTSITGYSLGAWHAAFVANLDDREHKIGFDKVLLVNPPLNLYHSLQRLDNMLTADLPNGVDGLDTFLQNFLQRLVSVSPDSDAMDFSNENMLLEGYMRTKPTDARMATTIGIAFRLAAANMVFTSDVMSHAGYIYPKDKPFRSTTKLEDYLSVALRTGIIDYYHDIYTPMYLSGTNSTEQDLIDQSSLETLRGWIATRPNIGLITNKDDIILGKTDLATLEDLFRGKSHIFPTGGHLGNLEYPMVGNEITKFFQGEAL